MDYEFVEITDPQTGRSFYASLVTGDCTWEKPKDKRVKYKNPDENEWWELFDENHKLPYYYNTKTGETEWLRPTDGTVIPLITIQNSSIGKRVSVAIKRASTINTFGDFEMPANSNNTSSSSSQQQFLVNSSGVKRVERGPRPLKTSGAVGSQSSSLPNSNIALDSDLPAIPHAAQSSSLNDIGKMNLNLDTTNSNQKISQPIAANPDAANKMNPFSRNSPHEAFSSQERLLSTSSSAISPNNHQRKSLPLDLKNNIEKFRIDGFAKKYFAEHRRGIFRRKVPVEKMLHFQKESLKQPLMLLNKSLQKEAIKTFKLVQKVMGDRSSSNKSIDDAREVADIGILRGELRDEIYVQICKQLSHNPNPSSVFKGWQLMCVLAIAFPPSKNLEEYLMNFIRKEFNSNTRLESPSIPPNTNKPLDILARHLHKKMGKICKFGPRGKPLTNAEVERSMDAPFRVSIFGEPLTEIMESQNEEDLKHNRAKSEIPRILPFLTDAILNLNGRRTEGIFRVPGDAEEVIDLRCRIEKGNYDLSGISDPNTPSSLLKLWLRELTYPLIPIEVYERCIKVGNEDGESGSYEKAIAVLSSLPEINQKVVSFMINFLRIIGDPVNVKFTKMTIQNIAMVFAPNFLRCPSDNPAIIFENTKYEQAFLRILLRGGDNF